MPAIDHPLIDQFLDALWLEKGLSDNTRTSYRSDLALFNGWLQEKNLELINAGRELILDHLAWRVEQAYKPRSTARFLSGVRGFYRYLLREKLITVDPTLRVDMPQLGRPLPNQTAGSAMTRPSRTAGSCCHSWFAFIASMLANGSGSI